MTPEQEDLLAKARESLGAARVLSEERYLLRGMAVRHAGDYGKSGSVTLEESKE